MKKLLRPFFRSGQRSGHQSSPKVKFCRVQHFSTNRHITREPEELQRREKANWIAPRRAGGCLNTSSGFSQMSQKQRRRAPPSFGHLLIHFSAHIVKISDPGHSRSGHKITSSDLTSEKV